jgi:hypothetical protein
MAAFLRTTFLAVLLTLLATPSVVPAADRSGRSTFKRDGGVNRAPLPGIFTVVSVDAYNQIVRLRADDGSVEGVFVDSNTFDVSTLSPGDRIQVNFLEPDGATSQLRAGNVWKVK